MQTNRTDQADEADEAVTEGAPSGRRPACPQCLRAQRSCICRWRRVLVPVPQVLILQHPMEMHQAKGTGRLLHLSLQDSVLAHGEQFDDAFLHALLYRPVGDSAVQPVLLYPDTPDSGAAPAAGRVPAPDFSQPHGLRLVILDATWRKSRKMLHQNPLLRQLPRLSLNDPPVSRYHIRKAHRADQLSTLEAACHALAQLEGDTRHYQPLLQAFDGFIAQQHAYVPAEVQLNDRPE